MPVAPIVCPFCSSPVGDTAFFCPTCGKKIKEKPLSVSIGTQLGVYLVSILFSPLFIVWTIKYLRSNDPKAKQIGFISLGLTIITLIITLWVSIAFLKNITTEINQQLLQYQTIGL